MNEYSYTPIKFMKTGDRKNWSSDSTLLTPALEEQLESRMLINFTDRETGARSEVTC